MRLRNLSAAVFTGLWLALAAPVTAHAADGVRQITLDNSESGAATIHGQDIVNAGQLTFGGNTAETATVGEDD